MRSMIDMAKEAGMTGLEAGGLFDNFLVFEALVRADEREACAKEFDRRAVYVDGSPSSGWYEPDEPARIIRARGQT